MFILWLLVGAAPLKAQAAEIVLSAGGGSILNNHLTNELGIGGSLEFRPKPILSVGMDIRWFPPLQKDKRAREVRKQLVDDAHVSPDSMEGYRSLALRSIVAIYPAQYTHKSVTTRAGFGISGGMAQTQDLPIDLESLDAEASDERATRTVKQAKETQSQTHGSFGLLLAGEIWWTKNGLRLRYDTINFIETFDATYVSSTHLELLQVEYMRSF